LVDEAAPAVVRIAIARVFAAVSLAPTWLVSHGISPSGRFASTSPRAFPFFLPSARGFPRGAFAGPSRTGVSFGAPPINHSSWVSIVDGAHVAVHSFAYENI
jgi:hypothetical protein